MTAPRTIGATPIAVTTEDKIVALDVAERAFEENAVECDRAGAEMAAKRSRAHAQACRGLAEHLRAGVKLDRDEREMLATWEKVLP